MMIVAAIIGALGSVIGVLLAWHLNVAPSASIVVTISIIFLLAFLLAPGRGLLRKVASSAEVIG
jgi:ABC-type Mn2+/Zn2+ transport system permease subunit